MNPAKILIVKPSSLGDVLHSLPFLNAIKTCFPQAQIHWVIARGLHELLEGHPMINRLWIIDKDLWKKLSRATETVKELKALFSGLRKEKFDLVIDLQGLLRSGLITMATKSRLRIGFREAREGSRLFYTQKVTGGRDIHAVDRYLKVAASLGCKISEVRFPLITAPYAGLPENYAVLAPGARWKTKRWPPERFGEVAALLPFKSIIVGSKSDEELSKKVVERSRGNAVSLAGKTGLQELTGIIKGARFLLSNDSGPMHIAAALGTPVFAVFGPTSPTRTGPYPAGDADKRHTIIKEDIPCAPCFKKTCKDLKCMEAITVQRVIEAIEARSS